MRGNDLLLPQYIYEEHLSVIESVNFTRREIDVIACLLNARRTNKTASLLSISPNTVIAYIRNILLKLGGHSREDIIDFIERTHKFPILREYYINLLNYAAFEKSLKAISKLKNGKTQAYIVVFGEDQAYKNTFVHHFENHLKQAGIYADIRKEEINYKADTESKTPYLSLLLEKENSNKFPKDLFNFDFIYQPEQQSYYLLVFSILKKLFPEVNFENIFKSFMQQYNESWNDSKNKYPKSHREEEVRNNAKRKIRDIIHTLISKNTYLILVVILIGILFFTAQPFKGNKEVQVTQVREKQIEHLIRSDLFIPTESVLLYRPEEIKKINAKLGSQTGIQTVALVGPGGVGKSILARQYAHQLDNEVIWEFNAETYENLKSSFENFSQALAKTKEDQKVLRSLQEIKDPTEKEAKLIVFVKERLRVNSPWCLIFDNVERFMDIERYFPQDTKTWGEGKVILTTRDSNIQNNGHLNGTIQIGELNAHQQLTLFTKIITNGETFSFTTTQKEEAKHFLEKLPPYPLDISVAAYYLKATHVSYAAYLKNLTQNNKDFASIQENLLKDAGSYTKTRYSILTLSLQHLINAHKDFRDLLLFISLLDSQNILRDLLDKYKDNLVVDNFIYNLKKYSLIIDKSSLASLESTISVHRSTQAITLEYLKKLLGLEKDKKAIQPISLILSNYITRSSDKENLFKMKLLLNHYETFLSHSHLLTNAMKGSIGTELGSIYFSIGNYKKAKSILEKSLLSLKADSSNTSYDKIAQNLACLGNIEREFGNFEKAAQLIEQALDIYKKHYSRSYTDIALALGYLGNIYRSSGDHEKAKNLLEQAITLHTKYFSENHNDFALTLGYLGIVELELGNYEQSKNLLERSFKLYKKLLPKNHIKVAWASGCLGRAYAELANYETARNLLEQTLAAYKENYPEDHDKIGWAMAHLGNVYKELSNYKKAKHLLERSFEIHKKCFQKDHPKIAWVSLDLGHVYLKLGDLNKAKELFEQALIVYKKYFSEDHVYTAGVLKNLGQAYLLEGDLGKAESLINQALKIYQREKHLDIYMPLETLSEICVKKSEQAMKNKNTQQYEHLRNQAIAFLDQALKEIKTHFSKDSQHIKRIRSKIEALKQKN